MPGAAGPRFRENASPIRLRKDPAGVPRCPLTADVTGDDPRQCGPARAPCRPPEPPDPAGTLRTPWSWPGRTRAPAHSRWPAPPRDWRAALAPRPPSRWTLLSTDRAHPQRLRADGPHDGHLIGTAVALHIEGLPDRLRPPARTGPAPGQARIARTRVSTASRGLPVTGRRTRSARSTVRSPSEDVIDPGVCSTAGSCGPPVPSVRFVTSCPTTSRTPTPCKCSGLTPSRAPPPKSSTSGRAAGSAWSTRARSGSPAPGS